MFARSATRIFANAARRGFSQTRPFSVFETAKNSANNRNKALFLSIAAATAAACVTTAVAKVNLAGEDGGVTERTFMAIKPDGCQRGLIADIIGRMETKGYKLVGLKLIQPTEKFAAAHYDDLKARPFFPNLCKFMASGPVVAMVWEGPGVIKMSRTIIGQTNPLTSAPGTIRGDYATSIGRNIIHGSDSYETAIDEIALWFKPEELVLWNRTNESWISANN